MNSALLMRAEAEARREGGMDGWVMGLCDANRSHYSRCRRSVSSSTPKTADVPRDGIYMALGQHQDSHGGRSRSWSLAALPQPRPRQFAAITQRSKPSG